MKLLRICESGGNSRPIHRLVSSLIVSLEFGIVDDNFDFHLLRHKTYIRISSECHIACSTSQSSVHIIMRKCIKNRRPLLRTGLQLAGRPIIKYKHTQRPASRRHFISKLRDSASASCQNVLSLLSSAACALMICSPANDRRRNRVMMLELGNSTVARGSP